jgi:YggT family protein
MYGLVNAINLVANILVILVIAKVLVSYFLDPYHPIRRALDNLVEPFLAPIRRILPTTGMIDFSPMVLILLIEFLVRIIISILIR